MNRLNVDVTGAGPHIIVPAQPRGRILVQRFYLTFSHDLPKAQPVSFWCGSDKLFGPFYVNDGGVFDYEHNESAYFATLISGDFRLQLVTGLSAAGIIEYELGAQ